MSRHSGCLKHTSDPSDPGANCDAQFHCVSNGVSVGLTGFAVWRGETISPDSAQKILQEVAHSYLDRGSLLLNDLEGPFGLSIAVPARAEALLAVDRFGIERLCYAHDRHDLFFSDSASWIATRSGANHSIRHQALFDYLFMHMVPAPNTVYEGVFKLPPATYLMFQDGAARVSTYWQPTYEYADEADFPVLKGELFDAIRAGIESARPDDHTGAFLSGGLDSSSITGIFAEITDEPAKTFTVGFGEGDYDELHYARVSSKHFACDPFEYQMSPADIVDVFPRIASAYDEPFGNSSAAPTYYCAKLAADHGVTHLLAGDGGDEIFAGNERYIRQTVFENYRRIPALLRTSLIEPATRFISPTSGIAVLRKARSYVDQARIPLPERFESWNFMYREGREQMLDPEFAQTVSLEKTIQLMDDVWKSAPSENLLEKMLWYDWRFTLADNDLRKVNTMSGLAGVRVSYPLLHPDVVDLSTRVPPGLKIKSNRKLRYFFRTAMSDFLPREILEKSKHGFGSPFGVWLKTDPTLSDMIYTYLGSLKARGIIDGGFIDELIAQHRAGHPSYYGYAIWDLAMLEAWLAFHT